MSLRHTLVSLKSVFLNRQNPDYCFFNGQSVSEKQLLSHAHHISQLFQDKKYYINLCENRYYFAATYLAGILSNCPNLLPPNQAKNTLLDLMKQYPDSICITDQPAQNGKQFFKINDQFPKQQKTPLGYFDPGQITSISFTSGTTGQPKAISKTWREFQTSAKLALQQLQLENKNLTVVTTVPLQHMFGLETSFFWPLFSSLIVENNRPFFPEDIRKQLAEAKTPCLLVTTPKHLKSCVNANLQWQNVDRILSSTAPMSLTLAEQIEDRFNAPLYEIFGSTETLSYASRQITKNPKWHTYQGIQIKQQTTQFVVSGGHLQQPKALDDQFTVDKNGDFTVIGRSTDLIKIAGKRTSLQQLNNLLQSLQGIDDGVFFVTKRERLGAVVTSQLTKKEILESLKQFIDPVFLPRPLYFVEQIPRNELGKLIQSELDFLIETFKHDQNSE